MGLGGRPVPKFHEHSQPRAVVRADRRKAEDALYRKASAAAKRRDQHCRICGGMRMLETHHVERRSSFGTKYLEAKHDRRNLLTVCGPSTDLSTCHGQLTKNILKAFPNDHAKGTDGTMTILKYSGSHKDYVVAQKRA